MVNTPSRHCQPNPIGIHATLGSDGLRPGFVSMCCLLVLFGLVFSANTRASTLSDSTADPKPASTPRKTPLMVASRAGDVARVRRLLARGVDVNQANGNGGTALMYAALGGHATVSDLLIRHGARVDAQGVNGWGALMIACAKGYVAVVQRLLDAGANPNLPDIYGWTPLMRAVYERRSRVVATLTEAADLDLDAENDQGSTALHIAAVVGDRDAVRGLLRVGADANIVDHAGLTPAEIADARGDRALARLLRHRTPSAMGSNHG